METMQVQLPPRTTSEREKARQALDEAGIVMPSERQKAMAQAIMSKLHVEIPPTRAHVRATLAHLTVPLSDEIIAMRGE